MSDCVATHKLVSPPSPVRETKAPYRAAEQGTKQGMPVESVIQAGRRRAGVVSDEDGPL